MFAGHEGEDNTAGLESDAILDGRGDRARLSSARQLFRHKMELPRKSRSRVEIELNGRSSICVGTSAKG